MLAKAVETDSALDFGRKPTRNLNLSLCVRCAWAPPRESGTVIVYLPAFANLRNVVLRLRFFTLTRPGAKICTRSTSLLCLIFLLRILIRVLPLPPVQPETAMFVLCLTTFPLCAVSVVGITSVCVHS